MTPGLRTDPIRSDDRQAELKRVRLRRALVLMVMTLLLPGSAQLVAGRKDVGRVAIRIWLGTLLVVAVAIGLGAMWHGFAFHVGSNTFLLGVIRIWLAPLLVVAVAIGLGAMWHGFAFQVGSNTFLLGVIRIWLALLAIGWA